MSPQRRQLLTAVGSGLTGLAIGASIFGFGNENRDRNVQQGNGTSRAGARYVPPDAGIEGIQSVIDEAGPNVDIQLDRGEYVGSELRLDNGVQLVGLGRNSTSLVLADGAETDLVVSPAPDEQSLQNVGMRDITFEGGGNDSGCLVYGAFWNGRFVDCDFIQAPDVGFWLAGSTNASTDDNVFERCRFIDGRGDAIRQGGNRSVDPAVGVSRVHSCWFGHNRGDAVQIRGNANVVADGKFYGNGGVDVNVDRGTRNRIVNNDMSKEVADTPCVVIRASQGVNSVSNRVDGNVFDGTFREAVYSQSDGNAVVALQVHSNVMNTTSANAAVAHAIYAEDGTYRVCTASHNTTVGGFSGEPIDVPDSWAISGNVVGSARNRSATRSGGDGG